jgi:RNA polymerase sigma factor (sigma-70 family)
VTTSGGVAAEANGAAPGDQRRLAASALIESHDAVFRRTARRYSICAADSEDAYQRALEILLTKAPPIEGDSLVRWMQVVTKREALAVRRQRERMLSAPRPAPGEEDRDPLDSIASDRPDPTDRAAGRERVARSGEALRALKPQEVRALTLKAEGYSYSEIGEITGWTYTKINRCMAEGRKRFLEVFAEIEQGRRCGEYADALSALADGERAEGADDLQAHLRGCGPCRAKLRAFRAIPDRVLEAMPAGPVLEASSGGRAHEWIADKAGAVSLKLKETGYAVMSRGAGDTPGQIAAGGGTRGAGMAAVGKLLAVCGATAAGSAACVAGGVVDPGAVGIDGGDERAAIERPAAEAPAEAVPTAPERAPAETAVAAAEQQTPAQQARKEFGVEASAESSASSGGEFSGPSGGGSGGASSGSGGFGFEK